MTTLNIFFKYSESTYWWLLVYYIHAATAAKSLQSCPTLCDPTDGSSPGCPVPGILQARTLEWAAISFSNAWKWKVKVKSISHVQPSATPWTTAFQAPPSMGFSRQEYWSGVPLPSPCYIHIYLLIHEWISKQFSICIERVYKLKYLSWTYPTILGIPKISSNF